MSPDFYTSLAHFAAWATALPLLIGLLRFRSLNTTQKRVLWLVILYALTAILASRTVTNLVWLKLFGTPTNLPLLHLFTVVQFWIVIWCYREYLFVRIGKSGYWGMQIGFALFAMVNALILDGIFRLNPHARAVQSFLLLPVAIGYLLSLLRKMEVVRLEAEPLFWFSSFVIIYFSGSFFIFLGSNYFIAQAELLVSIYGIHSILSILSLVLFTIILCIRKPHPEPISH